MMERGQKFSLLAPFFSKVVNYSWFRLFFKISTPDFEIAI